MTRALRGWSRSRPIRVAFLVGDVEHSAAILDAIFADSYDRWGGRFTLVVPYLDGKISPAYWRWLKAYDADLIYSYVSLDRDSVLELHQRLYPASYIEHQTRRDSLDDPLSYRPEYGFEPLSSLSTIFRSARYTRGRTGSPPMQIIDSWFTERASRFVTDNFGTYHTSRRSGIFPVDATGVASLLTIVSPEARADRTRGVPRDLNAIDSESEAFVAFAEGRSTSLSVASLLFATKLEVDDRRWSTAFNLVVGEGFADRVMFWNARLLIPSWLDNDLCCFRIIPSQVSDADFLGTLTSLLNRRNHVNAGTGGQPQLVVRSCSLDADQLKNVGEALSKLRLWSEVRIEVVSDLDAAVPDEGSIKRALEYNGAGSVFRSSWSAFSWDEQSVQPPTVNPDHLADVPPRQVFASGYWAQDYLLDSGEAGRRYGDGNLWLLPYRWRMARSFRIVLTGERQFEIPPPPRRSRPGGVAVFCSAERRVQSIAALEPFEAFAFAFVRDGQWVTDGGPIEPPAKVQWMQPSNEARYFAGVLGLAGGLEQASDVLLHPFLRNIFTRFGGTPALEVEKALPTASRLQKLAARFPTFDLRSKPEVDALADLIVKAARSLGDSFTFVRYDDLKDAWKKYLETYMSAHPRPSASGAQNVWGEGEEQSLEASLIWMRRRQILFQGHRWTCFNCHHQNWVELGDLASDLACEVCKVIVPAPVSIDWLFRPNEFLVESIRDHSVLSLVWALAELRERSQTSFIYAGPTWFYFNRDFENPDAEADLVVSVDGRAFLCEVKSSWRGVRVSDIRSLVDLSMRLRPDVALLAVMEQGSAFQVEIASARAELAAVGIHLEVLTPNRAGRFESSFLPAWEQ